MAGPCFWRDLKGVVQECGEGPEPQTLEFYFRNGFFYDYHNPDFIDGAIGFQWGGDFELRIGPPTGPMVVPMVFEAEQERYAPGESIAGDEIPGVAVQGSNQWNVLIFIQWT
ncbi:hypothetical protein D7V18_05545 [Stenotrophomonas maltophilia]|nr:hypothetical protein [Stenotrophomonas maltophilia]